MVRKKSSKQARPSDFDDNEGNVDKIREILFGGQLRDLQKRIIELEKAQQRDNERAAKKVDKLSEQVKAEKKLRAEDAKKAAANLKALEKQVESWIGEIEDQIDESNSELKVSVVEKGNEVLDSVESALDEVRQNAKVESEHVADTKIDRTELAELLTSLSNRLTGGSKNS